MIRRKKNGALRFSENIENSEEQEVYCVKINPKLWYKDVEGIPSYTTDNNAVDFFIEDYQAEKVAQSCGGIVIKCVTIIFYEPIKINHVFDENERYLIRLNKDAWYQAKTLEHQTVNSCTKDIFKATSLCDFDEARHLSRVLGGRLYRRSQYNYEDEYF